MVAMSIIFDGNGNKYLLRVKDVFAASQVIAIILP